MEHNIKKTTTEHSEHDIINIMSSHSISLEPCSKDDAILLAEEYRKIRHPGANAVVLFGSASRDSARSLSDVDILVVRDDARIPLKEQIIFDKRIIQSIIISHDTLHSIIKNSPITRNSFFLTIIMEGIVVLDENNVLRNLIATATEIWTKGPHEAPPALIEKSRLKLVNSLLALLRGSSHELEIHYVYEIMTNLRDILFYRSRTWKSNGKFSFEEMKVQLGEKYHPFYACCNRSLETRDFRELALLVIGCMSEIDGTDLSSKMPALLYG